MSRSPRSVRGAGHPTYAVSVCFACCRLRQTQRERRERVSGTCRARPRERREWHRVRLRLRDHRASTSFNLRHAPYGRTVCNHRMFCGRGYVTVLLLATARTHGRLKNGPRAIAQSAARASRTRTQREPVVEPTALHRRDKPRLLVHAARPSGSPLRRTSPRRRWHTQRIEGSLHRVTLVPKALELLDTLLL